ncbi:hypothetical protein VKT23_002350 [Stygiomarasmius scandens]|uniref:Uncharacterized protein n=1 Tax=Marasmiellus scandens TaxID=2682957 RepID=A0ABR1K4B4_9AGAR
MADENDILDYYSSVHHQRTLSSGSTSSEYSVSSFVEKPRRKRSEGGSDRRRIAIVDTGSPTVALVAPPDAARETYSNHIRSPSNRENSVIGPHFLTPESRSPSMKTPEVGAEKPIHDPVAGPVVDYLSYQLGFHSTAGPLPPPPRAAGAAAAKRDIEAVKQALQLPPNVQAALHRREAATTPTTTGSTFITPATPAPAPQVDGLPSSESPEPEIHIDTASSSESSHENVPSPPPKSLRHSLTKSLKRMSASLPKTPPKSPSPSNNSRSSSLDIPLRRSHSLSRTPSPSIITTNLPPPPPPRPRPRKRIKVDGLRVPAMTCYEVPKMKHANERCVAYAQKINELYVYDSGLLDWLWQVGYAKAPSSGLSPIPASPLQQLDPNPEPSYPSTFPSNAQHPRQVSTSSANSDVTFPRRPDASLATDLMVKEKDKENLVLQDPSGAPNVPYPTLPSYPQRPNKGKGGLSLFSSNSNGSGSAGGHTPPGSTRSLQLPSTTPTKTGFFASLGRKASINKRGGGSSDGHGDSVKSPKLLVKSPPHSSGEAVVNGNTISSPIAAVPIQMGTPGVRGGPRALPGRYAHGHGHSVAATPTDKDKGIGMSMTDREKRILRSQTMMVSPGSGWASDSPVSMSSSGARGVTSGPRGEPAMKRRPSLYDIPSVDHLPDSEEDVLDLTVKSDSGHTYSNTNYSALVRQKTKGPRSPHTSLVPTGPKQVVYQGHPPASASTSLNASSSSTRLRNQNQITHQHQTPNAQQHHQSLQLSLARPNSGVLSTRSSSSHSSYSAYSSTYSSYSPTKGTSPQPSPGLGHGHGHEQNLGVAGGGGLISQSQSTSSSTATATTSGTAGTQKQIAYPQSQTQGQGQSMTMALAQRSLPPSAPVSRPESQPQPQPQPQTQSLTLARAKAGASSSSSNSSSALVPRSTSTSSYPATSSSSKAMTMAMALGKPQHNSHSSHNSNSNPESSWHPEFARQVDKLHDLLPHAERYVLAGYLKRAGQDMLAIGQYLEDEKLGRVITRWEHFAIRSLSVSVFNSRWPQRQRNFDITH